VTGKRQQTWGLILRRDEARELMQPSKSNPPIQKSGETGYMYCRGHRRWLSKQNQDEFAGSEADAGTEGR